tara:strand:- start:4540 stop:5775 length:1236 start_codon:yes stop_codon:yes gene_type:complete
MDNCIVCGNKNLNKFLDLGKTALANNFLELEDLNLIDEEFYPLRVAHCNNCFHVQLIDYVDPKKMFDNYLYISSASKTLTDHLYSLAKVITRKIPFKRNDLVIDIGSNDGTLLSSFKKIDKKLELLGVEPAKNLVSFANKKNINCVNSYLDIKVAKRIVSKYGNAKLVTSTNSFPHIQNLHNFMNSVNELLSDDGVFVLEAHYLVDLFEQKAFDTVYHEHISYWSVGPMQLLFKNYEFEIFDIERLPVHHGQIRVWVKKTKNKKYVVSNNVKKLIKLENQIGLRDENFYKTFAKQIYNNKELFLKSLSKIKKEGKTIVGYGAPAKGNTLLTFFDIDKTTIPYISDISKLKQNKFSPGKHIPIVSEKKILEDKPDYVLILAWNFADEIIQQLSRYREGGGKFIIPVPSFKIL